MTKYKLGEAPWRSIETDPFDPMLEEWVQVQYESGYKTLIHPLARVRLDSASPAVSEETWKDWLHGAKFWRPIPKGIRMPSPYRTTLTTEEN